MGGATVHIVVHETWRTGYMRDMFFNEGEISRIAPHHVATCNTVATLWLVYVVTRCHKVMPLLLQTDSIIRVAKQTCIGILSRAICH